MTVTSISTDELTEVMEKLKHQQHQRSTDKNYYGIWKQFNDFFIKLEWKPDKWEDQLALLITYHVKLKAQSKTIRSYYCAIKSVFKSENIFL